MLLNFTAALLMSYRINHGLSHQYAYGLRWISV